MLIVPPDHAIANDPPPGALPSDVAIALEMRKLSVRYGARQALDSVSFAVPARRITALIGPSASGKSSLLRCVNRLNDEVADCRVEGEVLVGGANVYAKDVVVHELRRRVGMVFQRPNPFPLSVYDNVAYGPRLLGVKRGHVLDDAVESALRAASLWDEVATRLDDSALRLSLGQQQRLVIARALAVGPEILL